MPVIRGSTHKLIAIREVTFGTTPATPTMVELPITNFQKSSSINILKSDQIRTHPFVDKMLQGRFMHELTVEWELQNAVHDLLLESVFGVAIAAKAAKFTDALLGMSMESQAGGGSSLFDQFIGSYLNKLTVSASASDTAPVKCSASGMALTATLDAAATISSSVTAAANNDPFVFHDASLTVNAGATAVVAGSFTLDRVVDPLMLWNSRNPREFVPGAVTATGTITIPYDTNAQSTIFNGFTDAALVFKFASNGGANYRQFTFPKTKFGSLGRQINTRAGIMQEVNFEAYYDSTSGTVCTLATQ